MRKISSRLKWQTAERISKKTSDNFIFQRSLLAYYLAAQKVYGTVLEIGTGMGYGIDMIAEKTEKFYTIDQYCPSKSLNSNANVSFIGATVPPIPFDDNKFDCVISFQVIEHIKEDVDFISEIYRVLKPGGFFILTTPNKEMSLARNPFHVREYTPQELRALLSLKFIHIQCGGTFGNEKVAICYEQNKSSVNKFMKWDFFDFQNKLPRRFIQIPYDILNRINRLLLLRRGGGLVESIKMEDYSYSEENLSSCYDLFYTAIK